MLPHEQFVPRAPAQPGTIRVEHGFGCAGESQSLRITHEADGTIRARCYRCGEYGQHLSEQARKDRMVRAFSSDDWDIFEPRPVQSVAVSSLILPALATNRLYEFSTEALQWLNKYGITATEAQTHGFLFHPPSNRLILPVWQDGELVMYQTRRLLEDGTPKYITTKSPSHPAPGKFCHIGSAVCTVTEDILSGIKCARVTDSLAILGASLSPALMLRLMVYEVINIFLDNDSRQIRILQGVLKNTLELFGKQVRLIKGNRDPKELSTPELREVLNVQRITPASLC